MKLQAVLRAYCELFVSVCIGLFVFQITARLKKKTTAPKFVGPFSKGELLKYLVRCVMMPAGFVLAAVIDIATGIHWLGLISGVVFVVFCMILPAVWFDHIDKR